MYDSSLALSAIVLFYVSCVSRFSMAPFTARSRIPFLFPVAYSSSIFRFHSFCSSASHCSGSDIGLSHLGRI